MGSSPARTRGQPPRGRSCRQRNYGAPSYSSGRWQTGRYALTLNPADRVHGRFDPLGVFVPELRKVRLVEKRDFVADIGNGGLELLARGRLTDCVAHHLDRV